MASNNSVYVNANLYITRAELIEAVKRFIAEDGNRNILFEILLAVPSTGIDTGESPDQYNELPCPECGLTDECHPNCRCDACIASRESYEEDR